MTSMLEEACNKYDAIFLDTCSLLHSPSSFLEGAVACIKSGRFYTTAGLSAELMHFYRNKWGGLSRSNEQEIMLDQICRSYFITREVSLLSFSGEEKKKMLKIRDAFKDTAHARGLEDTDYAVICDAFALTDEGKKTIVFSNDRKLINVGREITLLRIDQEGSLSPRLYPRFYFNERDGK